MQNDQNNEDKVKRLNDRIHAEGFYLVFFGLMILMLVRVLVLNHPFESTWDITALFLLSAFYITIRHMMTGNLHEKTQTRLKDQGIQTKKVAGRGIFVTVLFIILMVIIGEWSLDKWQDLLTLALGGVAFFLVWTGFYLGSHKISQAKARKKSEEDDNDGGRF